MDGGHGDPDGRERPPRSGWRGKLAVGAMSALVSLVVSSVVFVGLGSAGAPAGFNDVPPSHPFYDDIGAVAASCITGGYDDGGFHPADPVTRQAMAAFINRSRGRVSSGSRIGGDTPQFGAVISGSNSARVPIATVNVTIPDLPGNCSVPVHLAAHASLFFNGTWAATCYAAPCNAYLELRRDDSHLAETFTRYTSDWGGGGLALHDVVYQPDGTTQSYTLTVRGFNVRAGTGLVGVDRQLVATVSPR